ncbi:bZIP transcription factor 11-like [Impatiens glandulifera]|uniref:bZIP transcription factor 11-like n=1 Tax=Impatiens glandulifera TaxID=253017 RepID=UPI001FB1498F|nr:bZIP transcription factor 11-like [Impatiens glandulifera]
MANYYSSSRTSSCSGSTSKSIFHNNNNKEQDHDQVDEQQQQKQLIIDEQMRKRKRMVSNRESARRSRLRKQKHENDLTDQVCQLNKEKKVLITGMNRITQKYLIIEAENRVLRAQMVELSNRLQSLNEIIISFINNGNIYYSVEPNQDHHFFTDNYNHINAMMLQY